MCWKRAHQTAFPEPVVYTSSQFLWFSIFYFCFLINFGDTVQDFWQNEHTGLSSPIVPVVQTCSKKKQVLKMQKKSDLAEALAWRREVLFFLNKKKNNLRIP